MSPKYTAFSKESDPLVTESALVLDASQRSALAVTRSLGRAGLRVTTAEAASEALAGHSRYASEQLESPCPLTAPKAYVSWLSALMAERAFDFVVPVTEVTSQLLLNRKDALPGLNLPFAGYDTVMALADKGRLMELAAELGIPHPETQWFARADKLDESGIEYPVVLKPCLSKIFTGESWVATRVRVLHSREDLKRELERSAYLHEYPFMLQSFIPGNGAGVFCLYDQGRPVTYFAHKRLREKPPEGGVSVLSESALPDPSMQAYATRLLDAVDWHGVAMVEFRVAPDGTPYLMEVNTRFWGSLQLAIDAGVDFPRLLWGVHQRCHPQGPDRYRVGQRLRWLLGDIDSLYLYLRSTRTLREKAQRLLEFATPRFSGLKHEVNRWGDLRPAWFELRHYLKDLTGR